MKTNEAPKNMYVPKKIYLPYKDGKVIGIVKETGVPYKSGVDGNIEYIRTDAFIEKALAYLNEKFYFNNLFYGIVCTDFHTMEEMYEDFRKYMEGE